jgi:2-polyprenyl-3-methyl-5-hydroxy-6-metoxy-1,4-benzoquinol methylase
LDLSDRAIEAFLAATLERPGFPGEPRVLADTAFEARLAVELLRSVALTTDVRILEVGAGSGTVTAFLKAQGANIVGLEPVRNSYEGFDPIRLGLEAEGCDLELLHLQAEELDPAGLGQFDFIFSVNVIEHFQPLESNLDGMAGVLSPGGRMLHTCPNYRVPYEPHLRTPLIPADPGLTARLRPALRAEPVWGTLNWVTVGAIRRFARRHNLALTFRSGQLSRTLERLSYDPAFATRQKTLARVTGMPGIKRALRLLPTTWSTPMTFDLVKPADARGDAYRPSQTPLVSEQ